MKEIGERQARLGLHDVYCRAVKGKLQAWQNKLEHTVDPGCRTCGKYAETGRHVGLVCTHEGADRAEVAKVGGY